MVKTLADAMVNTNTSAFTDPALEPGKASLSLLSPNQLYRFSPPRVLFAESEADIVAAVKSAAAEKQPIRAIGAMHSYAPIFSTAGTCLVLERYCQLLSVESFGEKYRENHQVTVQAGMTLAALNEQLAKRGLALPVMSAIAQQTISGAISTGTHGGSYHHPSLSGCVRQLRLVRADGSVITLQPTDETFNAVALSIGLLGIISTVTLACVPAFTLVARRQALAVDDFIEQFAHLHQHNQYLDVKYVPITDCVQILKMNSAAADHPPNAVERSAPPLGSANPKLRSVKTTILKQMLVLFQKPGGQWLQYLMFKRHENNIYPAYRCDRSDLIFTELEQVYYDPIPLHNMEIAVPYPQATAALQAIRQHFARHRRYPNIFIRLRVCAAEPFWLSPAYGTAICWFDFCEYPYSGQFFREVVSVLKPFALRSHWGKEIHADPAYLKQRYEKWQDFVTLRDCWDPNRLFSNDCLDRFFSRQAHPFIST